MMSIAIEACIVLLWVLNSTTA